MDVATLAKNWWAIALRGVAAIIFGVLTLILPGISLAFLVLMFGAYVLVDGVFSIVAALRARRSASPWWALLFEGITSVAFGVVTFIWPGLTTIMLLYVIAAWAVVTGVLEIVAAVRLRKQIRGEWWLALCGVLSVAFGVLVMLAPGAGALAMVMWIGAYAVVFGALLVVVAFRLRGWRDEGRVPLVRAA